MSKSNAPSFGRGVVGITIDMRGNAEDNTPFSYNLVDSKRCAVHEAVRCSMGTAKTNRRTDGNAALVILYHIHIHVHESMDAVSVDLFIGFWYS